MKTKKGKDIPKPENYDFPDPDANEEEMYWGVDVVTCLHKAAEYEKWAECARDCGRDELVIMYENAAERWFKWYKDMEQW